MHDEVACRFKTGRLYRVGKTAVARKGVQKLIADLDDLQQQVKVEWTSVTEIRFHVFYVIERY